MAIECLAVEMTLLEEKLRLAEMSVNEVIETLQDRGEGVQLKASEMLRQQQAEIEALKILVDELAGYKASYENGIRMEDGYGLN